MKTTGLKLDALKPNSIRDLKDYKKEIEEYLNTPRQPKMPALNQDQLLTDILRTFNSSYPHNLLNGDTGIGKTVLSDFILETFSSEENYKKSMEVLTLEQQKLMSGMKQKFKSMQNESQLYLPNFENPRFVEPFTYKNQDDLEQDGFAMEDFGIELADYMEDFGFNNLDLILKNTKGKEDKTKISSDIIFKQFVSGMEEIIKENTPNFVKDSKLHEWTNQLMTYIKKEKKEIEKGFLRFKIGHDLFEKSNYMMEVENENQEPTKSKVTFEQFLKLSPEHLEKAVSNGLSMSSIRGQFVATIKFNEVDFSPDELFTPNIIENYPDEGIAKPVKIGNQGLGKALGTIASCNQGKNGIYPPHATVKDLGPLFKGSIIYVKDAFKEFLDSTAYLTAGSKEKFLTFLETGDLVIETEGIEYKFHIPKMLLGSDNRDPFIRVEDSFKETREVGLEARITQHKVPSFAKNDKKGRENTLDIITIRIEELNAENETKIEFNVETLEQLLKETQITDDLLLTKYRDLRNEVENIYQYANSTETQKVTIDTLRKIQLEKLPVNIFTGVDQDVGNYEYKNNDETISGSVNGLYVSGSGAGGVTTLKSKLIKGRGEKTGNRFTLTDLLSGNGDHHTHKGFLLAEQFLTNFLSQIEDKDLLDKFNWSVSSHFHKLNEGLGGDSASTAIAASIVSELSEIHSFKNRYITGTLEPNGIIGAIGGIYEKSTGPYRIADKSGEEQIVIFPASNLENLRKELITDPLRIEDKISLIPVDTFSQAFELLTTPQLTTKTISNSQMLGEQTLNRAINNIEQRLKQEYKPTKRFFSFMK
jgi:hypothetical protein